MKLINQKQKTLFADPVIFAEIFNRYRFQDRVLDPEDLKDPEEDVLERCALLEEKNGCTIAVKQDGQALYSLLITKEIPREEDMPKIDLDIRLALYEVLSERHAADSRPCMPVFTMNLCSEGSISELKLARKLIPDLTVQAVFRVAEEHSLMS